MLSLRESDVQEFVVRHHHGILKNDEKDTLTRAELRHKDKAV
jgi:hypothetical protein